MVASIKRWNGVYVWPNNQIMEYHCGNHIYNFDFSRSIISF